MSDVFSPVVGGTIPPALMLAALPLWGLSGYPRGRMEFLSRGALWFPDVPPSPLWRGIAAFGGLMLLELIMCSLGSFFFAWPLLVGLVASGFGLAIAEYGLRVVTAGDDFSSSVS